jgi:hypothetical protein
MNYRLLGKSGLRVSELCLGTMTFEGRTKTIQRREITVPSDGPVVGFGSGSSLFPSR